MILGAWAIGGVIALAGAFVYAELAAARPEAGGVYAYLRDAFHPWTTMLFVAAFWIVALNTVIEFPTSAGIGVLVLPAGVPVYLSRARERVRRGPRSSTAPPSSPNA